MPSTSKAQQHWMGMKYAKAKKGHNDTGMSLQQLHDFAATSTKGLPKKKKKGAKDQLAALGGH